MRRYTFLAKYSRSMTTRVGLEEESLCAVCTEGRLFLTLSSVHSEIFQGINFLDISMHDVVRFY
jgi:hypothetical protein